MIISDSNNSEEQFLLTLPHVLSIIGLARRGIAFFCVLTTLTTIAIVLTIDNRYTAVTTMLPSQSSSGASTSSSALARLESLAPGTSKTLEQVYIGLLQSRTVNDKIIQEFSLQERYDTKTMMDTRNTLNSRLNITSNRTSSLIIIEFTDTDPQFAAKVANAYPGHLRTLLNRLGITEAQQRRSYYEEQVEIAKHKMQELENEYRVSQEKSGISSLDVSTQAAINTAAQLRTQIAAKEVQVRSMRNYATPSNPEFRKQLTELESLNTQLQKIEQGEGHTSAVSEASMANVRAYKELKFQESIVGTLITQLAIARAEEAKEAPLVQQIDQAVAPDKKSGPTRAIIVLLFAFLSFLTAVVVAIARYYWKISQENPIARQQWKNIITAWKS